jgi:HlyD family secretion protein
MAWKDAAALLKRHGGQLALGVLVLGVGTSLLITELRGPTLTTSTVVRRDFVQTVVASGRVASPHRIDIGSQVTGTVIEVPVRDGQTVTASQVLVRLNSDEARATLAQADLAVRQAEIKLRQLREVQAPVAEQALRQAQATAQTARAQWQRQQDLFRQGFIGQAALDESARAMDVADAQARAAQKQAETARAGGADLALADATLVQARATADAARARLAYQTLQAPLAGTLITRNVEVGDVVQAGKVLFSLSPSGVTQLVLQIDEKNLRLLRLGQPALASADADPAQRFNATLAYINPGVNAQTGAVEVRLDVPQPPALLQQDMTVSVDIEVARRPQALLVPADAVHDEPGEASWVMVVRDGRAQRQTLRTGLRSPGWIELLDTGLQPGDAVLPVGAAVQPGGRVHAVSAAAASAAAH